MKKTCMLGAAVAAAALVSSASAQTFYTDLGAFQAQLDGPSYTESFNGWTYGNPLDGSQLTWDAPGGNGYGWQASATLGLWSNPGALSTNNAGDPIVFTFTGNPVTAFGGLFAGTDINGDPLASSVSFLTSDGDLFEHTVSNFSFIGFTSSSPIVSVTIDSPEAVPGTAPFFWAAADDVITGAAVVPEPASALALATGGLLLLRRRK